VVSQAFSMSRSTSPRRSNTWPTRAAICLFIPTNSNYRLGDQDRGQTQKKIETYLAGALAGDKATHTM